MQGALLSHVFEPIYLSTLVIGEIPAYVAESGGGEEEQEVLRKEVERAVSDRVVRGLERLRGQSNYDVPRRFFFYRSFLRLLLSIISVHAVPCFSLRIESTHKSFVDS